MARPIAVLPVGLLILLAGSRTAVAGGGPPGTTPPQPAAGDAHDAIHLPPSSTWLTKTPNIPSLIVGVHGFDSSPAAWANDLHTRIDDFIISNLEDNPIHQVDFWAYDWSVDVDADATTFIPPKNAEIIAQGHGQFLAHRILEQYAGGNGYDHVQFVAHSLGGRVIETASRILKAALGDDAPSIHMTFLDAYTPYLWEGVYGENATYAEHYYTTDSSTGQATRERFPMAYNLDITARENAFFSSHGFPHTFYRDSVTDSPDPGDKGFGWAKAWNSGAGAWPNVNLQNGRGVALPHHNRDGDPTVELHSVHRVDTHRLALNPMAASIGDSTTDGGVPDLDEVATTATSLTLSTSEGAAAWINMAATVPAEFNYIRFALQVLEVGDAGTLSVYLNGEWFYDVYLTYMPDDEIDLGRIFLHHPHAGDSDYARTLPGGAYRLSFRLDNGSDFGASVRVSDINFGLLELPEPGSIVLLGAAAALLMGRRRSGERRQPPTGFRG